VAERRRWRQRGASFTGHHPRGNTETADHFLLRPGLCYSFSASPTNKRFPRSSAAEAFIIIIDEMQYETFWTARLRNFLRAARLCLIAASLCAVSLAGASPQTEAAALPQSKSPSTAKRATSKPKTAAQTKPAAQKRTASKPKPKTLSAKEQREAEQRLAELGYWTGTVDGKWDAVSRQALIAFQKVEGRRPTGRINRAEFEALLKAQPPAPRETGEAHIEIDLHKQVLFFVDEDGAVSKILPISSGNGKNFTSEGWTRSAVTPPGRFNVYLKIPGWKKSPLGRLYYPNYILGGIAIHGYSSVPVKPASHGCIRIPMFAAREFSQLTPIGTSILVYEGQPVMAEKENPDSKK
jgi:N-acetylmuramoyl-L-alanine amidase